MRSLEPNTCSPSACFSSSLYLGASGEKRKGEKVREGRGEGEEKGEKEMRVYRREERSKERRKRVRKREKRGREAGEKRVGEDSSYMYIRVVKMSMSHSTPFSKLYKNNHTPSHLIIKQSINLPQFLFHCFYPLRV